jgi:hypothetical protein
MADLAAIRRRVENGEPLTCRHGAFLIRLYEERLRVNVGLLSENTALKRRAATEEVLAVVEAARPFSVWVDGDEKWLGGEEYYHTHRLKDALAALDWRLAQLGLREENPTGA